MDNLPSKRTPLSLLNRLSSTSKQEDWARFVRLYTPLLYSWARRFGFSSTDASDCVQDVFLLLIVKLPKFQHEESSRFRAWLWTVFLNRCRQTKRRCDLIDEAIHGDLDRLPSFDTIANLSESEDRDWMVHSCLKLIRDEFPEATWHAFWEYVALDKPALEVARKLDISVEAVYQAKTRVLRRLREVFPNNPG